MLNVDVLGLEIWFLIFSLVRGSSSFNQLVLILILVFVPSNPPVKLKEIFQIEVSPTHASPRCWLVAGSGVLIFRLRDLGLLHDVRMFYNV